MKFLPTATTRITVRRQACVDQYVVERLFQFQNPKTGNLIDAWRELHIAETFEAAQQMQSRLAEF